MNIKPIWKYAILAGMGVTAVVTLLSPLFKPEPECLTSQGQTVIRWKNLYYSWCSRWWNAYCIWPIRRPHTTYKITLHEGTVVRDERGRPIPVAGGKIRKWETYDSITWNELEKHRSSWKRVDDYEPIAENEYVVLVETRYRLLYNVQANLRICTQKP